MDIKKVKREKTYSKTKENIEETCSKFPVSIIHVNGLTSHAKKSENIDKYKENKDYPEHHNPNISPANLFSLLQGYHAALVFF